MTTIAPTNSVAQIADALQFARESRHFDGCPCAMFRDKDGAPHCTDRAALWNRAIDRLLENIEAGR